MIQASEKDTRRSVLIIFHVYKSSFIIKRIVALKFGVIERQTMQLFEVRKSYIHVHTFWNYIAINLNVLYKSSENFWHRWIQSQCFFDAPQGVLQIG